LKSNPRSRASAGAYALGRIIISFRVSLQTAINSLLAPDSRWRGSQRGCQ
jgi:hypothetical protein